MENAAKALLIAGGVLITIIVVSIGAYLMKNMGEQTAKFYEIMERSEAMKYNEQFLKCEGKDLNMQDVISIMNLARDNNEKNQLKSSDRDYIKVTGSFDDLAGNTIMLENVLKSNNYENHTKELIKIYTSNGWAEVREEPYVSQENWKMKVYFTCKISTSKETLLVNEVKVTQHNNL